MTAAVLFALLTWGQSHRAKELREALSKAHFMHVLPGSRGLTYQKCRFCPRDCYSNSDDHGDRHCYCRDPLADKCRGLWKYSVRHYMCSECRKDVLIGLKPGGQP